MRRAAVIVALIATAAAGRAQDPAPAAPEPPPNPEPVQIERVYVVETQDLSKEVSYEVMLIDDYMARKREMALKNRLLARALGKARQQWKEDHGKASKAFPSGVASPGKVQQLNMFTSREKAEALVAEMTERWQRQQENTPFSQLEDEIRQYKERAEDLRDNQAMSREKREFQLKQCRSKIEILEEELTKRRAIEAVRHADLSEARGIFEGKLSELLAAEQK